MLASCAASAKVWHLGSSILHTWDQLLHILGLVEGSMHTNFIRLEQLDTRHVVALGGDRLGYPQISTIFPGFYTLDKICTWPEQRLFFAYRFT